MFKFLKKRKNNNNVCVGNNANDILVAAAKNSQLPVDQLKKAWLDSYLSQAEDSFVKEFNNRLNELKQKYINDSKHIIVEAFSRLDYEFFRDEFITKIQCRNNEIKSRLVGLNGRNKKTFERTCGVELIINENDEYIILSSANHIKREIANLVLAKLIEIKNIEPNKISNFYQQAKQQFEEQIYSIGKSVIEKTLKFKGIDPKIYPYIGKLKYRYSFGQNILEHSIESAYVAELLAQELKVDSSLAKMCAFFHDLGKSVDHETENDHVQQGVELAKRFNLPPEVISAILSHHDTIPSETIYDVIVKIADKTSACKPGARKNSKDDFFKRVKVYEDICYQFKEVKTCYTLKSGFVIKIIVKPDLVRDDEMSLLAYRIKQAFEAHPDTKNYVISLELIKESSFKIKTNKNNIFE